MADNKIKNIIKVGFLVIFFMFARQCGIDSVDIPKESTVIKHDTIWPDTMKVEVPKPYLIKGDSIFIEIPVPIPIDSLELAAFFNKRYYKQIYRDSNGVYTVEDTVLGYLLNQKLSYRSFKPLSITNSTITSITPEDGVKAAKKWEIRGGVDLTPSNMFLGLDYQRNKTSYSLGYDPFNKIPKVGMKYTLLRNRK